MRAWQVMAWRLNNKGLVPLAARGRKIKPPVPLAVRERKAAFVLPQEVRVMLSLHKCLVPLVARGSRERLVPVMVRGAQSLSYACPAVGFTQALPQVCQEVLAQARPPVLRSRMRLDGLQKCRSSAPM